MSNSENLREEMNHAAQSIAGASPNADVWRASLISLLEALESKAQDRAAFESMLSNLCDDLAFRLEEGRWQYT